MHLVLAKGAEKGEKKVMEAGQGAPCPQVGCGYHHPHEAMHEIRKGTGKVGGGEEREEMFAAESEERGGEAMRASLSLRAYLLPAVPGERFLPSMPRCQRGVGPEEARVAATTWEDRIWYKL